MELIDKKAALKALYLAGELINKAEEKAKEYVDKYQADKFFECATNRVFKIIPTIEGDKE